MKVDPRNLRPAELVRLLNSTPLGEVLRPHILYRHRDRAGFHIGDGRHVDLIRYAAWLIQERRRPKPDRLEPDYEAMKESARSRNARLSKAGRDIGEIPEIQHPRPGSEQLEALVDLLELVDRAAGELLFLGAFVVPVVTSAFVTEAGHGSGGAATLWRARGAASSWRSGE